MYDGVEVKESPDEDAALAGHPDVGVGDIA
jgi:hypothetical protein